MSNRFAGAMQPEPEPSRRTTTAAARVGLRHVGAYVQPALARQLRVIAAQEDSSTQALIVEAIEMLLQARGVASPGPKPPGSGGPGSGVPHP